MNRHLGLFSIAAAAALCTLFAPSACRADLFALTSSAGIGQIHRIDADSGAVLRTYDVPFLPIFGVHSGLAFDGRILYVAQTVVPDLIEIQRFDVVDEFWLEPPGFFPPIFAPTFDRVAGLGLVRMPENRASLIALSANQQPGLPGMSMEVVEIELFDAFPGSAARPVASFPAQFRGLGLDVDPLTNEIWLATRDSVTGIQSLKQIDLAGNVLGDLPIVGSPPVPPLRGVGFDDGRLFVTNATRTISEIDRTNGTVVRSFTLPITGLIGSLTGGEVVPEPNGGILFLLAVAFGLNRRQFSPRLMTGG
jgi:hypothetical protein